ncbi:MAG: YdjY domain-containing protein [Pirellulales bacterium]
MQYQWLKNCVRIVALGGLLGIAANAYADDQATASPEAAQESPNKPATEKPGTDKPAAEKPLADPPGFKRLSKTHQVWISPERRMLIVDGRICLRQGQLEMLACPQKTKEHEAIVAVFSDAMTVHAGLLAIGAKSGSPVQFAPEYKAATGSRIDVAVLWTDKEGKRQQMPAQKWVRHTQSKKELESSWVFAGSGFFVDEQTKEKFYQAETGDLICVSNFPTATLDLPVESSQANSQLEFEAFTDRIPPVGTQVRLVLTFVPNAAPNAAPPGAAPKKVEAQP